MALVAYDYDSNSDDEENEENNTKSNVTLITKKPTADTTEDIPLSTTLFSSLPETKRSNKTVEPKDDVIEDFIPKYKPTENKKPREKQKVKITIPSLSEFKSLDDDDEPSPKKVKQFTSKGSGLMGMLPPVQGSPLTAKSFVPKAVANKKPTTSTSQLVPNVIRQRAAAKKAAVLKKLTNKGNSSDADSDDDIEVPETFDDEMWQKVCGRTNKPKLIPPEEPPPVEEVNIAPEPEKPYDGLDNAAFKELVGSSKRPIGNIKLIDVNEEEVVPERDVWMAKSLTDPEYAQKEEVEDPVDPTRKKRHHITYLAQQAKANEQDLKNQWASSKNNRMATRAKYGF